MSYVIDLETAAIRHFDGCDAKFGVERMDLHHNADAAPNGVLFKSWLAVRERLERQGRPTDARVLFHCTDSLDSLRSILKDGFKEELSGLGSDKGFWGHGIYMSPDPVLCMSYDTGNTKQVIVSLVLCGTSIAVTERCDSQKLDLAVCNSHIAEGGLEIVIPENGQILPIGTVEFRTSKPLCFGYKIVNGVRIDYCH